MNFDPNDKFIDTYPLISMDGYLCLSCAKGRYDREYGPTRRCGECGHQVAATMKRSEFQNARTARDRRIIQKALGYLKAIQPNNQ